MTIRSYRLLFVAALGAAEGVIAVCVYLSAVSHARRYAVDVAGVVAVITIVSAVAVLMVARQKCDGRNLLDTKVTTERH